MSSKPRQPLYLPNDPANLRVLINHLEKKGYEVTRPSPYQVKVGPANYYWTTGRITIDPRTVHAERGAQAFLDLIESFQGPERLQIAGVH